MLRLKKAWHLTTSCFAISSSAPRRTYRDERSFPEKKLVFSKLLPMHNDTVFYILASNERAVKSVLAKKTNQFPSNSDMAKAFVTEIVGLSLFSYCRLLVLASVANNLFTAIFYLIFHPSAWRTASNAQKWLGNLSEQKPLRESPTASKLLSPPPVPEKKQPSPTVNPAVEAGQGQGPSPRGTGAGQGSGSGLPSSDPSQSGDGLPAGQGNSAEGASSGQGAGGQDGDSLGETPPNSDTVLQEKDESSGADNPTDTVLKEDESEGDKLEGQEEEANNDVLGSGDEAEDLKVGGAAKKRKLATRIGAEVLAPPPAGGLGAGGEVDPNHPAAAALEKLGDIVSCFERILNADGLNNASHAEALISALITRASNNKDYALPKFNLAISLIEFLNKLILDLALSGTVPLFGRVADGGLWGSVRGVASVVANGAKRFFDVPAIVVALRHIVEIAKQSRIHAIERSHCSKRDAKSKLIAELAKLRVLTNKFAPAAEV
jgi:hypothetical protein